MDFNQKPREDEATSWLWVGLWVLLIYVTVPLARTLQEFIRDIGGKSLFMWTTLGAVGLACIWIVKSVRLKKLGLQPSQALTLTIIAGIFSWLTWEMRANPEESIHFIQYGVLSLLIFRAFSHRISDPSIFVAAAMLGILFGIMDELLQWIVPRRFFAFRDIGINITAVVLVQTAIAFGIRPVSIRGKLGRSGLRFGFLAAAGSALLLLFAVSNTDEFKAWYSEFIPNATAVTEVTAEYGYKIEDPEIGVFFSRLRPEEIRRQDSERGIEVAGILDRYRSERSYGDFLDTYPVYSDPFLVEARIHLFRRDRYTGWAIRNLDDGEVALEYARIAFRENQILSKYFSETLRRSTYSWDEEMIQMLTSFCADSPPYRSHVSDSLITCVTRPVMSGVCAVCFVLLLAGVGWTFRRESA